MSDWLLCKYWMWVGQVGRGLCEVLSRNLPVETEVIRCRSIQTVSGPTSRFWGDRDIRYDSIQTKCLQLKISACTFARPFAFVSVPRRRSDWRLPCRATHARASTSESRRIIAWSKVIFAKHIVKTFLELYRKQNFIVCSQKTASEVYPEPDKPSPHPPIRFL